MIYHRIKNLSLNFVVYWTNIASNPKHHGLKVRLSHLNCNSHKHHAVLNHKRKLSLFYNSTLWFSQFTALTFPWILEFHDVVFKTINQSISKGSSQAFPTNMFVHLITEPLEYKCFGLNQCRLDFSCLLYSARNFEIDQSSPETWVLGYNSIYSPSN